jgi:hypothetical protein
MARWKLLAVSADALEEAGCEYVELHTHMREPGRHVPGFRASDLALGRT